MGIVLRKRVRVLYQRKGAAGKRAFRLYVFLA